MDVLVIGGSGAVGSAIAEHLDDQYSFTYLDVREHPDRETVIADTRDYEEIRPFFEGQDAVIHLAVPPNFGFQIPGVEWTDSLLADLEGTTNVYRAVLDAGVERCIYASSVHAVGGYESRHAPELYDPASDRTLDSNALPCPDSMYGVAKAFGEALGRFCATCHGLRNYVIRLGGVHSVADTREREGVSDHGRSVWCSERDLAQLVDLMLTDEAVLGGVFYGVSDNETGWLDIEHAREKLGYEPVDGYPDTSRKRTDPGSPSDDPRER